MQNQNVIIRIRGGELGYNDIDWVPGPADYMRALGDAIAQIPEVVRYMLAQVGKDEVDQVPASIMGWGWIPPAPDGTERCGLEWAFGPVRIEVVGTQKGGL